MSDQTTMSDSEKKKEDWMNNKWRPMMGWLYMGVCAFDFVLFPILWSLLQTLAKVGTLSQWQPLTLQGAGLFHIAMGAVLGIAALGRTQEKLAGANNGGASTPAPAPIAVPSTPAPMPMSAPAPMPMAAPPTFSSPAPVGLSSTGKKVVPQDPDPVL